MATKIPEEVLEKLKTTPTKDVALVVNPGTKEVLDTAKSTVTGGANEGSTVYKNKETGEWFSNPAKAASLTWNNSTGEVTINAPQILLDNADWMKTNFTENDNFRSLITAFKKDPTGQTSLSYTDEDGNVQSRRIADLLEGEKKAFDDYAKDYSKIIDMQNEVKKTTKSGINMNDDDTLIYAHSTKREKDKNSDSTVVYLTDEAQKAKYGLIDLDSYNKEYGTVSAKDFYNWYNMDNGPDGKDELINELIDQTGREVASWQRWEGRSEADTKDFDPTAAGSKYARAMSLYRTLSADNPEANVATSTRLFLASAGNSLFDNLYTATGNIYSALNDINEAFRELSEKNPALGKITAPMRISTGLYQGAADLLYLSGEKLAGIEREMSPKAKEALGEVDLVGTLWESMIDGDPNDLFDMLEKSTGLSDNLIRDNRDTVHDLLLDAHNDMTKLSSAATAGSIIGGIVGEIVKQIFFTNPVGAAAGSAVEAGATGVTTALFGNASKSGILSGLKIISSSLTAEEMAGAISAAGFTTNIVTQGISDTILNDEESLHRMFTEGKTYDALKAVSLNTMFNLIGEGTGLGATEGWAAFKKTAAGEVVSAAMERGVNRLAAIKHEALYRLAEMINDATGHKVSGADWYTAYHKEAAQASRNIANAANLAKEGETVTEATKRLITQKMVTDVAAGRIAAESTRTVLEIQATLKQPLEKVTKTAATVTELEKASGLAEQGAKTFTQDTTDYIVKQNRIEYLTAKGGEDLKLLNSQERAYLTRLQEKVAEYKATHSEDLVTAANKFSSALKQYQYKFENLMMREGVSDRKEILDLRSTGYWGKGGKNYMFSYALRDTGKQVDTAKWLVEDMASAPNYRAKTSMDDYSYKPGDADVHYLDPQLAMLSQQIAAAKVIDGRAWGDALLKNHLTARQIDTNGKPVTNRELNKLRAEANRSAEKAIKTLFTNEKYEVAQAFKATENLSGKIAKKEAKVEKILAPTEAGKKRIAGGLDSDAIDGLRSAGADIPEYGAVRTRTELNDFYNNASAAQKKAIDQSLGVKNLTVKNYNEAIANTDLSTRLAREYIAGNKSVLESKAFDDYARAVRKANLTKKQNVTLKETYEKIKELQKQAKLVETGEDEFTAMITGITDDVIDVIELQMKDSTYIKDAIKQYTASGVSEDDAMRYLALSNLRNELRETTGKLDDILRKNLDNLEISGNLTSQQKIRFKKGIKKALSENVESEWRTTVARLTDNGSTEILDMDEVFEEVYQQMSQFIKEEVHSPNVIRVLTRDGKYELWETSPVIAKLYNERPNFEAIRRGGLTKFFNKTNRLFRISTTGWSLSSFENQWVRDPLNSFIMGGLRKTVSQNAEELGELLGPNFIGGLQDELGVGLRTMGEDISKEVKEGATRLYDTTAPETQYYREKATGRRETLFGDYEKPKGKMAKALDKIEEYSPGNKREIMLRRANYVQAYNDALRLGRTPQEAKVAAEYVGDNATTNFHRAFAWGNQLVESVPYLGAAINGSASFWKLLEIDPLGVSGRLTCGLILPMAHLTTQSLQGKNKEVYMNVPEYVKDENIVFVVDGEVFKIPIPQELAFLVSPARHVVEKINQGNDEAFGDLILNDILGASPVDLSALADLDDPMKIRSDFISRLSDEGEALISQLSPVAVKTTYMAITGRDPYTHAEIDASHTYYDSDGNPQIMDYEDNAFAQWFSDVCKGFGWDISASSAEAIIGSFLGQTAIDTAGSITSLFSGDPEGAVEVYAKQATKPFTPNVYDQKNAAWRDTVQWLQAKKDELMNPQSELAKINNEIGKTSDPEKLKNLRAQYRAKVQGYRDLVYQAVERFNSLYGADYDYKKFASTINLLNFYSTTQDLTSEDAKADAQELYWDAYNQARQTMADMGFRSTNDYSIFGYLRTNEYGEIEGAATLPTAILNMDNIFYQANDETVAKINATISNVVDINGKTLKDKYNEMKKQESKLYATRNYDALNKLYKQWDTEFMTAIYPLLSEQNLMDKYGNTTIENSDVVDLLDNYIRVPSDAMGKGKYYSSKTGLNKQRGFAKSYLKKLYDKIGDVNG